MISTVTRRFTKRFQSVNVTTVSSLLDQLESISSPACKFQIENVSRDRVIVRAKVARKGPHPTVILPAYPTGHADDQPTNPNVVLDPLEFVNLATHADLEFFAPLLGHEVLTHYEKMHAAASMPLSRCC